MSIKLTNMVRNCGCAAKLSPGLLAGALDSLPLKEDKNLLIGFETRDDAGAYKLDSEHILLQTLDFFPPMVDDPYTFGQIAAANALSDIYAMGGKPLTAMNIVCFPDREARTILPEILKGGIDKIEEAGAVLVGGHSVNDQEPKYGLSVTGIVTEAGLKSNAGAKPGDLLILTKPIGTGIIVSAMKGGIAPERSIQAAIHSMRTLNKKACEIMQQYSVHSCTDITGFSLGGHCIEMAKSGKVTLVLEYQAIPKFPDTESLAEIGIVPEGTYRNRRYFEKDYFFAQNKEKEDVIFDPQTSGGLLIAVAKEDAENMYNALKQELDTECRIIGKVTEKEKHCLIIQ